MKRSGLDGLGWLGCGAIILVTTSLTSLSAEVAAALNKELFLSHPVTVQNVTVWPVYSSRPAEALQGEFVSLVEAQHLKLAEIREKDAGVNSANPAQAPNVPQQQSAQGSGTGAQVNELVIENKGQQPLLVLAGTLVKGGNQDRQIAQDFIVPPGKTVPVGAFCVEHGRWSASREGQATDGKFQAQQAVGSYGVRMSGQYGNSQGEVWNQVAEENKKAGKNPRSGTLLATVEETDQAALVRREALSKAIEERFAAWAKDPQKPVGLAYAVDGKVREIRSFAHPRLFERLSPALIKTIAIEGDLAQRQALQQKKEIHSQAAPIQDAVELVQQTAQLKEEKVDTRAGNFNGYRRGKSFSKASCYARDEEEKVPSKENAESAPVTQSWANH